MADTPATWADLSDDERDDALLAAVLSGIRVPVFAEKLGTDPLAVVLHVASDRFSDKLRVLLPSIRRAARLLADVIQPAQIIAGCAGKDGIAHKEFLLLSEKFGQFDKTEEATDPAAEERRLQEKLAVLQASQWKTRHLLGMKGEA